MANSNFCVDQFVQYETSCEQGICNPSTGGCECNEDWTNIGDFSFNPKGSCDLYTPAIAGLWIAQLSVAVLSILYAVKVLFRRYRHGVLFDRKTWRVGIIPFGQVLACSFLIVVDALKIVDQVGFSVGRSIAVVILTSLYINTMVFCLLCGLMVLMKASMALLPSQSEQLFELQKHFKILRSATLVLAVVGQVLCWSPVLMLVDVNLVYLAAILIGVGLGSMMLLIGSGIAWLFMNRLIGGIDETLQSAIEMDRNMSPQVGQLKKVHLKLRVARFFEVFGFSLGTVILFGFCFTPYLVKKASYFYPLAFIVGILAVDILIWSHQNSVPRKAGSPSITATLENKMRSKDHNKVGDITDPGQDLRNHRPGRGSLVPTV